MRYCKNCKREYPETKNFCEDCGGKLSKFVEHSEALKEKITEHKIKEKIHEKKLDKQLKHSMPQKNKITVSVLLVIAFIAIISLFSNSNASINNGQTSQLSEQKSSVSGQHKTSQAVVDACANVVCNNYCSNNYYYYSGNCVNGQCQYSNKYCDAGCSNNQCCYNSQESYVEQVPKEITNSNTVSLFGNKVLTVNPLNYVYTQFYIDVSNKFSNTISGNIAETAGYDINFFIFDQKNFNAWKSGQSYAPYVTLSRVKSDSFTFVPDHTDYYYFVFDNTYSLFTNKVPQITANWYYQYTTTQYVSVTKYRTVTKCD